MLTKPWPLHLQGHPPPPAPAGMGCEVRRHALFGVLDERVLQRLQVPITTSSVAAEERIYARGECGSTIYTVHAGIVRFERITEGGERRIVRLAGRGDLIGQEALLRQPYRDDAMACTPVALCRIPALLLDEAEQGQMRLARELMRRWQRALDDAETWSAELAAGPSRRRVLRLLDRLTHHAVDGRGERIWLPRRDQMGDMLDMTLETASRIVSRLRRERVLQPVPPQHAVLDRARLERALAEANA